MLATSPDLAFLCFRLSFVFEFELIVTGVFENVTPVKVYMYDFRIDLRGTRVIVQIMIISTIPNQHLDKI